MFYNFYDYEIITKLYVDINRRLCKKIRKSIKHACTQKLQRKAKKNRCLLKKKKTFNEQLKLRARAQYSKHRLQVHCLEHLFSSLSLGQMRSRCWERSSEHRRTDQVENYIRKCQIGTRLLCNLLFLAIELLSANVIAWTLLILYEAIIRERTMFYNAQ